MAYVPFDQDILRAGMEGKPVATENKYTAVAEVQSLATRLEHNFLSA